jgi:NADH-quinone oxidoreductase subunit N
MKYLFLINFSDFKYIIPEFFFFFSVFFLIFFLLFFSVSKIYKYPLLISLGSWLSVLNFVFLFFLYLNNLNIKKILFSNTFIVCYGISYLKVIVILFTLLVFISTISYLKKEKINDFEYFILLIFVTLGIIILISSNDFILTYLSIELQSLALFVLVTFKKNTIYSTEAGLKYFVLGSLASIFLLFGFSLLYFTFGTSNFQELSMLFIYNISFDYYYYLLFFSFLFIFLGFFFKLNVAPLHMWLPDIYEGSPTSVTLFMAVVPKIAFFFIVVRFLFFIFSGFFYEIQNIIIILAVFSMFIGSFMGIRQKKFKRLFAYSTISHVGFLLFAISSGSKEGIQALILYIIVYMFMTLSLWVILISLRLKKKNIIGIFLKDYSSLFYINPIISLIFCLNLLSMAGVPPLIGFWTKFSIFVSTINSNIYIASVIAILISSVSAFYYLRLVKLLYFNNKYILVLNSYKQIPKENSLILSFTSIFLMVVMIYPNFILLFVNKIVFSLI